MIIDLLVFWLAAGLLILVFEMLTAGFFLIFLAMGCFAAALSHTLAAPLWMQIFTCAVIAIVGALTLRKPILKRFAKNMKMDTDLGKEIKVDDHIDPNQQKRISYQGSTWLATNMGAEKINKGDHATIIGMDGNILLIRKK